MTFATGLSALRAHQTALAVTGHNIANASTPGFRRQIVRFSENPSVNIDGNLIGTGVSVDVVRSATSSAIEEALTRAVADGAAVSTRLALARRIETLFLPGTDNVLERVESFFNDLQRLSAEPDNLTLRSMVVDAAAGIAAEINRVSSQLDIMADNIDQEVANTVEAIRLKSQELVSVNRQLAFSRARGETPNSLLNERDLLVKEMSELIDVEVRTLPNGREEVVLGGLFIVGTEPVELTVTRNSNGELELWKAGCLKPVVLEGGKLGGLLAANNDPGGVGEFHQRLDRYTRALMAELDEAHAFGVGITGAFSNLNSLRSVSDVNVPIATAEPVLPLTAGRLFLSVTDANSQERVLSEINIDPATDSLQDIANAISAIDRVNAIVDPAGGNLIIIAESGFSFDFTGNPQTRPATVAIAGTTEPRVSGAYTGDVNDELTFTFLGSGTVGVEPGLRLEVRDGSGAVIDVLEVGSDYEPGSEILVTAGVYLALSSGSANLGDSFQSQLVSQPDETGFLAALGMNTLFMGEDASNIRINPSLVEDPFRLATTTTGDPSDTSNLLRMVALRDDRYLAGGTQTIEQYLANAIASVGREVLELTQVSQNTAELRQVLQAEIDGLSGVDMNEELAKMLEFQRGFQAAARYIAAIDESLQELIDMIR